MVRDIITIDEEKCNGCGACVIGCPEGAIQIIDGKARLVSDSYCDGLGACIGECPEDAITVERREADAYDEKTVMAKVAAEGEGVIKAHLAHLKHHGEEGYYSEAMAYLQENGYDAEKISAEALKGGGNGHHHGHGHGHDHSAHQAQPVHTAQKTAEKGCDDSKDLPCGCPGSAARTFGKAETAAGTSTAAAMTSQLTHWPVQMHLINPRGEVYKGSDLLLAADCTAYAYAGFHDTFIEGRTLTIACPKLDSNKEIYLEKLVSLIDDSRINTLTVAIMEVPCCGGLLALAKQAVDQAQRKIPVKKIVVGVQGDILSEDWV